MALYWCPLCEVYFTPAGSPDPQRPRDACPHCRSRGEVVAEEEPEDEGDQIVRGMI